MTTANGEDMATQKASQITRHITSILKQQRAPAKLPLIVGVQGPQGSGKTTVTASVKSQLEQTGKRIAVFSIDDLYLPHQELEELKNKFPTNKLLHGRGQPGTHDLTLGTRIFSQLKGGNEGQVVQLPLYDKSHFNGEGDRSKETVDVTLPLDVVIFEGWCMGFYPLDESVLRKTYDEARQTSNQDEKSAPFFVRHSLDSLLQINSLLQQYVDQWYRHIDAFVLLRPNTLNNVFQWRLEAEHNMKANGKTGMTDEQVYDFVSRYMPGYELFGQGPLRKDAPWSGKGLSISLDIHRDMLDVGQF